MRSSHYRIGVSLWAVLALMPTGAYAQQQDGAKASEEAEATDAAIVITGSRVVRDGSAAPTPVTAIAAETLSQSAPSNLPDALNRLPQFMNSQSQYKASTFSSTLSPQGNYLNLRGLGASRVLVLLDGNRVPPTTNNNGVDINSIPQLLVERVDVVTGGASATYGSDAISGVVNFILDKKFNGIKGVAQSGISTYGDGASYRFGLAAGTGFAGGRGHIEASIEHYHSDGLPRQDQRSLYNNFALAVGAGTATNPYSQVYNTRYNDIAIGGMIRSGPLSGQVFNSDGSVSAFVHGTATGTTNVEVGGSGPVIPPTALVASLETTQAFGRLSYELTDNLEFYAQGNYGRSKTGYVSAYVMRRAGTATGITIFADNPYLNSSVRSALGSTPSFTLSRIFSDSAPNEQSSVTEAYNVSTGLSGDLGGWKWDVNYTYGHAELTLLQREQNNKRFYAAVDAIDEGFYKTGVNNGNIVCRVTLVNPSAVPGCIPLNVIGQGNLNSAAIDWIRGLAGFTVTNEMNLVNANIRGDLFDLPAGPVSIAIGAEARWQKLNQTSNADPAVAIDYTGIRGVPSTALPYTSTNVGIASGTQDVKEAFAELAVPILKDTPFFKALDVTGAVRFTDYKTSGSVTTWKAGFSWQPIEDIRLRGTISRDIAAPSLYDLFQGQQKQTFAYPDVHVTGAPTGSLIQVNAGNPNLKPEKADTLTIGAVFKPSFAPRLTISADFYRIKINDALQVTSALQENQDCENSGGTAPVCALITRPLPFSDRTLANFWTQVIVAPQNLASLLVKGVDIEAGYRVPLGGGDLDLRAFVSYLDTYDTKLTPAATTVNRAGAVVGGALAGGLPRWRATLTQGYSKGGFNLRVTERWTGSYRRYTTETFTDTAYSPNRTYVDLYLSQRVEGWGSMEPFIQIDNLFNVKPPEMAGCCNPGFAYSTDKAAYDVLGRYFTAGVKLKF